MTVDKRALYTALPLVLALLVYVTLVAVPISPHKLLAQIPSVEYYVEGGKIYMRFEGVSKPIYFVGVNWFGFELTDYVVHGLWARNWEDMLRQIASLQFNAIRLPFCPPSVRPGTMPSTINYNYNPDLRGLDSVTIMEKIVQKASELGIFIIFDFHRIGCTEIEPLWYTDSFTEQDFINVWISVAQRFGKYPNVIGADIKNEPHSVSSPPNCYYDGRSATWGMNNSRTDWNLAVERIGNAILQVAPHWLIIVEGIQYTNPTSDNVPLYPTAVYWGENLRAVRHYPVNLPQHKLLYSPHTYGPDVYVMPYFNDPNIFPNNLHSIWNQNWGYIRRELGLPIYVGEFGGKYGHGGDSRDPIFQQKLIDYLIENDICWWTYWSWNANSGDTGGILRDDWINIWEDKYQNLNRSIQYCQSKYGIIKAPSYTVTPTTTTITTTSPTTTTTTVVTPTVTVVTVSVTDIVSVPLTLTFTTPITTTVTTTVPVTLIIPVMVTTTITTTSPVTTTTSPTTTATPTTTSPTTSAPGVRYSFTLNADSRVATVSGCIEFRVSGGSTTIGGVTVSPGSVLKICVNNDNALTWWIGTDGWLSANDLDASAVYVNGNQVLSNTKISLSGIQADLSTINSTLTITVTGTGQTSLTWNGQTVISGTDSRTLTISGVAPTTSKAMNLNIGTTTIYAEATATNYTLQ